MDTDDIDQLVSEAVLRLLKQQAVHEFFEEHDVTCPNCGTRRGSPNHFITGENDTVPQEDSNRDNISEEELDEARNLLAELSSWTKEDIEDLPADARKRTHKYQHLASRLS